jgi:acetyl esterase/lipase
MLKSKYAATILALTAATSISSAWAQQPAESNFQELMDQATYRVLQRFNGRVPANVKSHIVSEINKITGKNISTSATTTSNQDLLQRIDQALPQKLMDKLPTGIKTKLSTVSTNKFENMSYWPGLNDPAHQVSLYTPRVASVKFPLIVYIHGGGWYTRPKSPPTWVSSFVKEGFAVALVHYRLAQEGIFPAQMEDLNTCLRWLKTNAAKFNIDENRIGIWGTSAGGHLAALMGTSWNNPALDLGIGKNSRQVQAVCDFCGPSNLMELGSKMAPGQTWDTVSPMAPLSLLLGGAASNQGTRAVQASPVTYVNQATAYPPFLIVHGSADQIIPETQSEELAASLKAAGGAVMLQVLPGASHDIEKGGNVELAKQFFKNMLKP